MPTYKVNDPEISAKDYITKVLGYSNTAWKRIKHSDTFRVNGKEEIAAKILLINGDEVSFNIEKESTIAPEKIPLDIRYEDEYILIVNKPAGMLVHPTTFEQTGTLANAVIYHYNELGLNADYHPLHRLDRNTSGLVAIAKLPQMQYQLAKNGKINFHREYFALASGNLTPKSGTIDAPIARNLPSIITRKVSPEGKRAVTHYKTLKEFAGFSLLKLILDTGRTHQIRVHLAHIGHPLLGDDLYGGGRELIDRQALHAYKIKFFHPFIKEEISVHAPLPDDLLTLLKRFSQKS